MSTKNYIYGAIKPSLNLEKVEEQFHMAHRYYNRLIELEHRKRELSRALITSETDAEDLETERESLIARLAEIRSAINGRRSEARQGVPAEATDKREIKDLEPKIKELDAQIRQKRKETSQDPAVEATLLQLKLEANEACAILRSQSGLFWGTYQKVEEAARAAAFASKKAPPRFKRRSNDGSVSVHFQNKAVIETAAIMKQNIYAYIDYISPDAWSKTSEPRQGRHLRKRTVLHIRVGSDEKRQPIWAEVPFLMHRPLPKGKIAWVTVSRRQIGYQFRWEVMFTVNLDDEAVEKRQGTETAGIDVGWVETADGDLRVAVLANETGQLEELKLPAAMLAKEEHVQGLKALRSKLLDKVRPTIVSFLEQNEALNYKGERILPQYAQLWRSPQRIINLFRFESERMSEETRAELKEFIKTNQHLGDWECFERRRVRNQRKNLYREFAARCARQYTQVGVEDIKLSNLTVRVSGKPEKGVQGNYSALNKQKSLAAVGLLFQELKNVVQVVPVSARYTTKTCSGCQTIDVWDEPTARRHTCSGCGVEWDRDENAARNVCARALELRSSLEALAASKVPKEKVISVARQRRADGKTAKAARAREATEKLNAVA